MSRGLAPATFPVYWCYPAPPAAFGVPAGGNDWYISPTGSDSTGDGSFGDPWADLAVLFNTTGDNAHPKLQTVYSGGPVAVGDRVLLMSGTYAANSTVGTGSGLVANAGFVQIAAAPGQTPTFVGKGALLINDTRWVIGPGLKMRNSLGASAYRLVGPVTNLVAVGNDIGGVDNSNNLHAAW
jgi:hypothetical protein